MKKIFARARCVAGFFFVCAWFPAQAAFLDTFEDASRIDGSPSTWVQNSSTASNLSVVSDATMGSYAMQFASSAGTLGTTLPSSYSLSTSTLLSLSFDLRMTGDQSLRIGLFNSGSTALAGIDGTATSVTTDDQGVFVNIESTASALTLQVNGDGGTNSNVMYGTDRIYGTSYSSFASLGTTTHDIEITYLLFGSNVVVKVYVDSTLCVTQNIASATLSSFVAANGVNEILMISTAGSNSILIDNISLSAIPEPSTVALLFFGAGSFLFAFLKTLRNRKAFAPVNR